MHWFADAVMQSEQTAINKWSNNRILFDHVFTYSAWMAGVFSFMIGDGIWKEPLLFFLITFVCHFITDYFTSKISHYLFTNKKYYTEPFNVGGFSIICLDQILHVIQLLGTFNWLYLH